MATIDFGEAFRDTSLLKQVYKIITSSDSVMSDVLETARMGDIGSNQPVDENFLASERSDD